MMLPGMLRIKWATPAENAKIRGAYDIALHAFNSSAFRSLVLSDTYDGHLGFANTDDTPSEVLAKNDAHPFDMEIVVVTRSWWARRFSSATAATDGKGVTTLYRDYLAIASPFELANTLIHERQHRPELGYSHDWKNTARRPKSEPYEIGDQLEETAKQEARP